LKSVSKKQNFETIKTLMVQPGKEGTLEKRFKDIPRLYAKTGTLSNVSNIIGYFYDKNNALHSFVIMANNFYGNSPPIPKIRGRYYKTSSWCCSSIINALFFQYQSPKPQNLFYYFDNHYAQQQNTT
jgi:hypothetical protein